jgi:transcriptional regulator with GAF, ATPase, and Fis domain
MTVTTGPLLTEPKRLLLDMAREHRLTELLRMVVGRLAESSRVALARIWLVLPSDGCAGCPAPDVCRGRDACLHLAASAGRSVIDPRVEWTGLDGAFRRFPLGERKVGQIAATGEAIEVPDLWPDPPSWAARPEWMRAEGIAGFGGQPLVHRGQTLGVLAVFARGPIGPECMDWLRTIADHTAAAIATARAFAEIDRLRRRLEEENEYLREEVTRTGAFGELVGQGPALGAVARQIDLVAPTDSAVLVLGESGTGKELVAREVHRRGKRAAKPLVKVNCAAVPRELYESEFFGHARGAFTGALRDRAGRFELADGGTLFLDEVGEIPLELQAKLLRVLQEGELERVGEERTRRIDVRVIAATNRDLRAEAEAGRFRQDLYYRLSVFPIELPPLRKRAEDIPLLAEHFLTAAARKLGRPVPRLTLAAVRQLQQYAWPGNVRELQHVIERAVITTDGPRLTFDLPGGPPPRPATPAPPAADDRVLTDAEVRRLEADNIRVALKLANGKVSGPGGAAERLGLRPTTLASRIKALALGAGRDNGGGPGPDEQATT